MGTITVVTVNAARRRCGRGERAAALLEPEGAARVVTDRWLTASIERNALQDAAAWHAHRVAVQQVCGRVHALVFEGNPTRDLAVRTASFRAVTDADADSLWIRVASS